MIDLTERIEIYRNRLAKRDDPIEFAATQLAIRDMELSAVADQISDEGVKQFIADQLWARQFDTEEEADKE